MPREKLRQLQLQRLRETAQRVYEKVPFYRRAFDEKGVKPDDIRTLEDIQKLPFTKKSDLRENYPFNLFAVDLKAMERIHCSSGTKGKPTVVGYTRRDIENWAEICARALCAAGANPGDLIQNAYGYGLFTGGLGLHYGIEKLKAVAVPVSGGNTPRQITLIQDFQPRGICGTPSYILNVAEAMEAMGIDPQSTSLRYGVFGAEPWSEEMRQTLERKLGIKAVDIYGLSEVMGPGVSIECHEVQNGLHIAEDHFYPEIIDPETGQPLPYGEEGELVFTSLTKEAFPIIRYRTGDISSLNPEPCSCGRTTMRMARILGRIDDMLIIRGVNVFPREIESVLLTQEELVPHYQLVLYKDGPLDKVEVQVEINERFMERQNHTYHKEHPEVQLLEKKLQLLLKDLLGVSCDVNVLAPHSIPRSEGKAVRIIDERKRIS